MFKSKKSINPFKHYNPRKHKSIDAVVVRSYNAGLTLNSTARTSKKIKLLPKPRSKARWLLSPRQEKNVNSTDIKHYLKARK